MILILVFIAVLGMAGYCMAGIIGLYEQGQSFTFRAACGFCMACGTLPLLFFYLNLVHVPLNFITVGGICVILAVVGIYQFIRHYRNVEQQEESAPKKPAIQDIGLILLIVVLVGMALLKAPSAPMRHFDERAKWSHKAKIIYHEGTVRGEAFSDKSRVHIDRRYPLGQPYLMAAAHLWMGKFDEKAVKLIFPAIMAAMILGLITGLKGRAGLITGAYMAALPFYHFSPLVEGGASDSAYADLPLGCYYMFSSLCLYLWFSREKSKYLAGYGAFMAAALFTKQEAVFMYGISTLTALVIIFRVKEIKLFPAILYLIAPVLAVIPFYGWAFTLPAGGIDYLGNLKGGVFMENIGRVPAIIYWLVFTFSGLRWLFMLPLVVFAAILFRSGDVRSGILLPLALLPIVGYIFLITITPSDPMWQLDVAANRLIMHIAPTSVLFIGLKLKNHFQT